MSYPIIGLCGRAGVGKDTIADMLVEHFGCAKIAFADPMKQFAERWFPKEILYGSSAKRSELIEWTGGSNLTMQVGRLVGDENPHLVRDWCSKINDLAVSQNGKISARQFLQQLGTELGRQIDVNFWTNKAMLQAETELSNGANFVVVSDVRFRNEVLAIKGVGGVVVNIYNNSTTSSTHSSESEQSTIPNWWFDKRFYNDPEEYKIYQRTRKEEAKSFVLDQLFKKVMTELDPELLFSVDERIDKKINEHERSFEHEYSERW